MGYVDENFESILNKFFQKYKPAHLDKVPDFVKDFEGQELTCIQALCKRYFVDFDRFAASFDVKFDYTPTPKKRIVLNKIETTEGEMEESNDEIEDEVEEVIPEKKSKMKLIIIILVVLAVAAGGAFFMMQNGTDTHGDEEGIEANDSTDTDSTPIEKTDNVDEEEAIESEEEISDEAEAEDSNESSDEEVDSVEESEENSEE